MTVEIVLRFDVQNVDPARVDPQEIADYLFGLYDAEYRAGNTDYLLAENRLEAEWSK